MEVLTPAEHLLLETIRDGLKDKADEFYRKSRMLRAKGEDEDGNKIEDFELDRNDLWELAWLEGANGAYRGVADQITKVLKATQP